MLSRNRSSIQKLTPEEVREIRHRAQGGETQRSLAREFGVSFSTVNMLVERHNWWWVE